jgi:glycosyltransferase involved in cell wall biosynthesis
LSRIIKQGKCGYIYEDFNNKELAQIIKKLVNADLRKQLGESGYGLVRSVFNWSEDKAVLMDAIRYYYSYAR